MLPHFIKEIERDLGIETQSLYDFAAAIGAPEQTVRRMVGAAGFEPAT
jgi:hypothetical protein